MFGVQFHPESVCSEFGWQICSNVCRMARDRKFRVCRPARSSLDLPSPRPLTRTGSIPSTGNLQLFSRSFPVGDGFDMRTFFESFICDCRDIAEDEPAPVVWLDSAKSSKHSSDGRYTFMCGGRQARGSNLCVVDDKLELLWGRDSELRPDKSQLADPGDPFVLLREYCDQLRGKVGGPLEVSSLPPLIPPCILGTLGYDGQSTVYIVSDRILAIDHSIDMVTALQVGGDDSERWFDCVDKAVKECTYLCHTFCPTPVRPLELRVRDTRGCYMDKIEACQQAIAFGDSYELCLTTQITTSPHDGGDNTVCPLCAFIRLRQRNPTNYSAFMYLPTIGYVACGSPERFCKVAEGCVEMKPIKGTRPRGQDPAEDESLVADLATSPKDFAENLMVVDLVRNDLNTVCETGSVHCPKLMKVESYQNYHQLVSTVCGRLPIEEGYHASPVAALKALFPAGSMTGAPKVRACQILDSLESGPRGIYSGAIGYVAPLNDSADFAVVIRTIVFNGSTITTGCGGAIVAGSNTKEEWDEVLVKARPQLWSLTGHHVMLTTEVGVKTVIHPKVSCMTHLRLFETMLLKCGTIEFLDYHAQRFAASAAALWGVPRDEAEAAFRRILNTKLVGVIGPKRLRLEMNSELVEEGWRCDECPLPVATPQPLRLSDTAVDHSDLRLRHKTNDRRVYPTQPDRLLYNERGEVTETAIANVGVRREDGVIITPAGDCGLLPGCYRRWLLETGKAVEGIITLNMLKGFVKEGREIVCFNSVRGIWRAQVQVWSTEFYHNHE
ncbi:hypothetical protein FOZ63_031544 [Perkinsus olseni]|uniref:Chorismate-utilising enzyme C-terminal domain-containing protein n=1 Tax=Perkinsus olseni TaxID=32597 RepID=A0A7J6Q5C4_PEROL|nr:hypothetical protein FOZ63_031544 [Perkinsus olseni]